jgi:UDP-glucose 4-epimerase
VKLLIVGASGLIGGRLIRGLLDSKDIQIRGASRIARQWPDGVSGCVTDIVRHETLRDACRGMDTVVNLASMPERFCSMDPEGALRMNTGGTLAWASAAAKAGVSRFVQLSTYKVYGNNPSGIVTESTACKPESHYALTHRAAEDYAALQHTNSVVFRLANSFGAPVEPAANSWSVIVNEMCRAAAVDRCIAIRSSGLAWRNFVPMDDVVGALRVAIGDLSAGTYNLGSNHSLTLRALAERVARICDETLGFSPSVTTRPDVDSAPPMPPLDYRIDKLAQAGFTAVASFEDELRRTLGAVHMTFGVDAPR